MKLTLARAAAILAFCAGIAKAALARTPSATTTSYAPSETQDLAPIGIAVAPNGIAAPTVGQLEFTDTGIPFDAHPDNLETFPYIRLENEPKSHSSASSTHNHFSIPGHHDGHGPVQRPPRPVSSSSTHNPFSIPGHNAGHGPAQQSPRTAASLSHPTKTIAVTSTQAYYSNLTGGPLFDFLDDLDELNDLSVPDQLQEQQANNNFEFILDSISSIEPSKDHLTKESLTARGLPDAVMRLEERPWEDFKKKLEEIEAFFEHGDETEPHNLTTRGLIKAPKEAEANDDDNLKELIKTIEKYAEESKHDSPEEIERKQQESMGVLGAWLFHEREIDDERLNDILNSVAFRRSIDTQLSSGSGVLTARNFNSQRAASGWISDLLQDIFGAGLNTAIGQAGNVAQAGVEEAAHKPHHDTKHAIKRDNDEVKHVTKPDRIVQHLKHNSTGGSSRDSFLVYFPRYNHTDHRVYAHGMWYEIDEYGAITKYENQPGQAPQEYDLSPDAKSIHEFSDNLGFNMHQIPKNYNLTQEQTFDFTWEFIDEIVRALPLSKGGLSKVNFPKLIENLTIYEISTGSASHRDSHTVRRSADIMPGHNMTQEQARAFLRDFVNLKKALLHVKGSLEKVHVAKLNTTAAKDVHENSKNGHHNLTQKQRDFITDLIQKVTDITAVSEDNNSSARSAAHGDCNIKHFPRSVDAKAVDPLDAESVSEPVAEARIKFFDPIDASFRRGFPQRFPYQWNHPPDLGSIPAYKELVSAWKNTEQSRKDYIHKMLLNVWLLRISDLCEISKSWTKDLSEEAQEVELNFKGLGLERCQAVREGKFPNERVKTYWDVTLPKEMKKMIKAEEKVKWEEKQKANWANYRQRKADCMKGHKHIGWLICWMT